MTPEDFQFISQLIRQRSGLVLNQDKVYLLESRLMPVARKRGMKGLEELIVPIRLTHTPTTCSVAVIEYSGTSDLEGIVEFECRIIHK